MFCILLALLFANHVICESISAVHNPVLFELKGELKLSCNLSSLEGFDIEWEKDGIPISEVPKLKNRVKHKKDKTVHSLMIKHADEEDAGKYTCRTTPGSKAPLYVHLEAYAKIKIRTPSNVNVVEDETLEIICDVIGRPPPEVYWIAINETYTESRGRVVLTTDKESNIPNTVFTIEHLQMSDRGYYICVANASFTNQHLTHKTMVRVKGQYAALWPFIGICAEVITLVVIICIYEKKSNKADVEESDTDQSPDQKNTPNHGRDSNLRHRQ